MNDLTQLDEFTKAYIICALWTAKPDSDFFNRYHKPADIQPKTLAIIIADCKAFQEENKAILCQHDKVGLWNRLRAGGHGFWHVRNNNPLGFQSGNWPDGEAEILTQSAKKFPPFYLFSDDGNVYSL